MKAELKKIHSPDVYDMKNYKPGDKFNVFVQFIIGLHNGPGEEAIDSYVCSYDFSREKKDEKIYIEDRHIVMSAYNYCELKDFISNFIGLFEEKNWIDLVKHFSVLGRWEFDGYVEKNYKN